MRTPSPPMRQIVTTALTLALCALVAPSAAHTQTPEPTTYTDANVPLLHSWNGINALSINVDSQHGRTYLYPNAAIRDLDVAGDGTGSVAYITWDLDDASGRAPGIQTVTDDFAFPVQNCIMASGEREAQDFPGTIVPKTCSDAEGSAKRIRFEVTRADTPIDLVFNTGMGVLRYKGVVDPANDGGVALAEFREMWGIGRIYRVILKFINETGQRIAGVRLEVGTGVGDEFVPLTLDEDGVAFELRPLVDREFMVGNTGAPPREVWDPMRFAMFARKYFHDGTGRFPTGFFDVVNAGMFNPESVSPEDESAQTIFSGATYHPETDIYGAMSRNYFSMSQQQAVGFGIPDGTFGYLLPGPLAPYAIGRHDNGEAGSESDATMAWWDGSDWRYGIANDFAVVPPSQLEQWAALLLGVDNDNPLVGPERYTSALADDLSGINMDVFLRIQDMIVGDDGEPRYDTITMRFVAVSADHLGVVGLGTGVPFWAQPGNEAPPLTSYMPATGTPVALNDAAETLRNQPVTVNVLDNDLLDGSAVPNVGATTVVIGDLPSNGTVSVQAVTNAVVYTPGNTYVGTDSFTYTVEYDPGTGVVTSNIGSVTVAVIAPPDPAVPVAANDSASTIEVDPIVIDVLANDTLEGGQLVNGPGVVVAVLDAPVSGTVVVNADNTITYTANSDANFTLVERFTYTVSVDGTPSNAALVTVRAEVDETVILPEAADDSAEATGTTPVIVDVLANDTLDGLAIPATGIVSVVTQPANGVAVVNADGTITYTANADFGGSDAFTYTVTVADVVSNAATVAVVVTPEEVEVTPSGGGCGSCSTAAGREAPAGALLLVVGLMALRRRQRRART